VVDCLHGRNTGRSRSIIARAPLIGDGTDTIGERIFRLARLKTLTGVTGRGNLNRGSGTVIVLAVFGFDLLVRSSVTGY
jgi:hypothetical protein